MECLWLQLSQSPLYQTEYVGALVELTDPIWMEALGTTEQCR